MRPYSEEAHARADERALCRYERALQDPPEDSDPDYFCARPGPHGCQQCEGCERWADAAYDHETEDR